MTAHSDHKGALERIKELEDNWSILKNRDTAITITSEVFLKEQIDMLVKAFNVMRDLCIDTLLKDIKEPNIVRSLIDSQFEERMKNDKENTRPSI